MSLTVVTAADSLDLCSVADVKEELNCGDEDQATLVRMVRQASDAIVAYCGRQFAKQEYLELVKGFGGSTLMLTRTPVVSVSAVSIDGSPITDFTIQDPETGALWREQGWDWTTLWSSALTMAPIPGSEEAQYSVQYFAGYDLPDALLPNLPGDIERAAIVTVKDWYQNRKRNLSVKEFAAQGNSFVYSQDELPPPALRLLSRWRETE